MHLGEFRVCTKGDGTNNGKTSQIRGKEGKRKAVWQAIMMP
jgi:hypothetical protein